MAVFVELFKKNKRFQVSLRLVKRVTKVAECLNSTKDRIKGKGDKQGSHKGIFSGGGRVGI